MNMVKASTKIHQRWKLATRENGIQACLQTTAGHLKGMYFRLNIPGNQLETHFRMNTTKKLNTVSSTSFQCGCTLLHHPGYGPGGEASLTCQVADVDKELNQRVQFPLTTEEWLKHGESFDKQWNILHCLGAMDGMHTIASTSQQW